MPAQDGKLYAMQIGPALLSAQIIGNQSARDARGAAQMRAGAAQAFVPDDTGAGQGPRPGEAAPAERTAPTEEARRAGPVDRVDVRQRIDRTDAVAAPSASEADNGPQAPEASSREAPLRSEPPRFERPGSLVNIVI
jgi:hypothetical protein